MKVKICGITTLEDAKLAVSLGAFALGFNFYPDSPRYIEPKKAKTIIEDLPKKLLKVGIFVKTPLLEIEKIKIEVGLDLVQVYEEMAYVDKKLVILALKANSINEVPPIETLKEYGYVLLDAPFFADKAYGGTGKCANWEIASLLSNTIPLILAGGLNANNIHMAIKTCRPLAVDLASGIESQPGKKDPALLKTFFKELMHAS